MRILVQGISRNGRSAVARAGRFWPCDEPKLVEVLDQEADPPPIKIMVRNGTTQRMEEQERPDPDRIGRATLRLLEDDGRISIKQEGEISSRASAAAVQAARGQVAKLSEELTTATARVAEVEAKQEELEAENAKLRARCEDMEKQLATADTQKHEHDPGKAKAGKHGR